MVTFLTENTPCFLQISEKSQRGIARIPPYFLQIDNKEGIFARNRVDHLPKENYHELWLPLSNFKGSFWIFKSWFLLFFLFAIRFVIFGRSSGLGENCYLAFMAVNPKSENIFF